MEVMLLAAGVGSRLKELTKSTPKCLIEISGKPILEWNLLKLRAAGASKIVINLHYLPEQVTEFLEENNNFGFDILFSREPELLNTGGGIKHAQNLFSGKAPILVFNADIICSISLEELFEFHKEQTAAASLLTRPPEESRVLLFSKNSHELHGWRNTETGEERIVCSSPDSIERGFCGIQVISPVIFEYLGRPQDKLSTITGYMDAVKAGQTVLEYTADSEYWFDIGTPAQLATCRKYFEEKDVFSVKR